MAALAGRLGDLVVAVVLGYGALLVGAELGSSLALLANSGVFAPVLVPVLAPVGLGARVKAALSWAPAGA